MDLILLLAIAYAGARGVESIIDNAKGSYADKVADATVKKAAQDKKDGADEAVPAGPGGTFSAREAAPRTATVGAKTAAGIAVGIETGSTFWKSYLEGYREARPAAREDARRLLAERAKRRQAERDAKKAEKRAEAAEGKAAVEEAKTTPPPVDTPDAPAADPKDGDGDPAPPPAAAPPVLTEPTTRPLTLVKAPDPDPAPLPTGDTVTIPEVRTLDGLLNALAITKGTCLMRAEEAEAIAADDAELSARLDAIEAELANLEVDPATVAQVAALREKISAQSKAAHAYGAAAQNAADLATGAAGAARMAHGGIAEAVESSPIPACAQAGYYNR